MTYENHGVVYTAEEQDNRRSADYMAMLVAVLMVVWLAGAAIMFVAAYKGSTMNAAAATSAAAAATEAPATAQ